MAPEHPIQTAFVIDDNDVDLFVQKRFMEINHFANEIVTFNSAGRALEAIQSLPDAPPEVIFLDLNMPAISGFDFLEHLKTQPLKSPDLKIVILTSSNSQVDYERALTYKNVVGFISKPLTIQRLKEVATLL